MSMCGLNHTLVSEFRLLLLSIENTIFFKVFTEAGLVGGGTTRNGRERENGTLKIQTRNQVVPNIVLGSKAQSHRCCQNKTETSSEQRKHHRQRRQVHDPT